MHKVLRIVPNRVSACVNCHTRGTKLLEIVWYCSEDNMALEKNSPIKFPIWPECFWFLYLLTSLYLTLPHLILPHLTSPHLTSPHLTWPHLTSPHLTLPHITSLTLTISSYKILWSTPSILSASLMSFPLSPNPFFTTSVNTVLNNIATCYNFVEHPPTRSPCLCISHDPGFWDVYQPHRTFKS